MPGTRPPPSQLRSGQRRSVHQHEADHDDRRRGDAPAAELFARPQHPYTQGLLRCIPVPGRTRRDEPLGSIPGLVPTMIGPQNGCAFANRCDYARDVCRTGVVPLTGDGGHASRCLFSPGQGLPETVAVA